MAEPPQSLILSLHIPKTGGTSFAAVLEQAFPGQVAYFYKPGHRRTHPLLRERGRVLEPAVVQELELQGIRVLHGHGALSMFSASIPEPSRYWTWVREPVERVISSFYYHRSRPERAAIRERGDQQPDRVGKRSLIEFAQLPANRNLQSRILQGAAIEAFGFVGLTEKFDQSLAALGLQDVPRREKNVNRDRPEVGAPERQLIAELNEQDVALYERARELHAERATPSPALRSAAR